MRINTITERLARRRLPGWLWFVLLWCVGVGAALAVAFAFKVLMNLTLFAIAK